LIGKESFIAGLLVAILLSAGVSSVYAHEGVDEEKQMKVEVEAEDETANGEYELKLKVKGPDGSSLTGNGEFKIESDDDEKVRNFEIIGSQVSPDGHHITLWSVAVNDLVVIDIDIIDDGNSFVTVSTTEIGSHTFPSGTFNLEVENE